MAEVQAMLEWVSMLARHKKLNSHDYEIYKAKLLKFNLLPEEYRTATEELAEIVERSGPCEKKKIKRSGSSSRKRS